MIVQKRRKQKIILLILLLTRNKKPEVNENFYPPKIPNKYALVAPQCGYALPANRFY